ncbi:MAG: phosphotriesterase [Candidatus Hermodarchaeota archaeon]
MDKIIVTVNGELQPEEMGLTLPHEHIMVDFIGAEKTGKHRYDPEDVISRMLPYLIEIRDLGVKTFVDCTPMYLGRDVVILKRLADLSELNIITNTGQYKEPYLPKETFNLSSEELSKQWIKEFYEGIEETKIRPGFIKTAVEPGSLTDIEKKLIEAAAFTSKETNLTIVTHTAEGMAALNVLDLLEKTGIAPKKWIFAHAHVEERVDLILKVAERGAWISIDGIGWDDEAKHLSLLKRLLDQGYQDQILISQDAGWYNVGDEHGGDKKPFTFLIERFLPFLRGQGFSEEIIRKLTIRNPAEAYSI